MVRRNLDRMIRKNRKSKLYIRKISSVPYSQFNNHKFALVFDFAIGYNSRRFAFRSFSVGG